MAKLTITTMPKCTVSMPAALTMGTSSGVRIRIAESGSTTQPTTSSSTFSDARIIHCESWSDSIHATNMVGTWLTVNSQAYTLAQARMIKICEVKKTVDEAASTTDFQGMSRYMTQVTNAA